jgi:hypothetical protein
MSTPIRWNASASRMVNALARPKWEEVCQGLRCAGLGYLCLFAFVVPGVLLVWLARQGGSPDDPFGLGADDATTLGWVLAAAGVVLGYLLLLAGQWRCLANAPQAHATKEFAFACLLCTLIAPTSLGAAYFLDGEEYFAALQRGPAALGDLKLLHGAGVLLLVGAGLGLLSMLLFCGFLHGLANCHGDEQRVRRIANFVWLTSFLVGGTAGIILHARSRSLEAPWEVLTLCWGLLLLRHVVLILGANRGIQRALQRKKSAGAIAAARNQGQVSLRVASLLPRTEDVPWSRPD